MASNAGTWFYSTPDNKPFMLQERVNSNLWMARLFDTYFTAESVESPFRMSSPYRGQTLVIEWEPGKWLRLTTSKIVPLVVGAFSNILQIPAALTYTNIDGQVVTEWHADGGDAQWRQIQGNPIFQSPVRLNR
jgi:hypothetical protein